jgi:hypothetical protein
VTTTGRRAACRIDAAPRDDRGRLDRGGIAANCAHRIQSSFSLGVEHSHEGDV